MSLFSPLATARKPGATKPNPSAPGPLVSRQNKNASTQPSSTKTFSEIEAERKAAANNSTPQDPKTEAPVSNANKLPDSTFKFNLAPHSWSLPTDPLTVDRSGSPIKDGGRTITSLGLEPSAYGSWEEVTNFHGMRRGRIWFYDTNSAISTLTTDESGNTTVQSAPSVSADGGAQRAAARAARYAKASAIRDRKFGFQFLWNPESISLSVDVNLEVTPSIRDRFRTVSGVFPSMEYINLNIILDRTNDFACIRSERTGSGVPPKGWANLAQFYKKGAFPFQNNSESLTIEKIQELAEIGTLHDLEYLFKTVNGSGIGETGDWANLLGRKTADIGFLQPTLLGIQLGPTGQSLSYVGWINSLNINHVAFNQSMVPIRTQVSMGIRCFTGSQVIGY